MVADTGAVVGLVDADDGSHRDLRSLFDENPDAWVLPWAILPEVDYMLGSHVSRRAQARFLNDIAAGAFRVEWGDERDLVRARDLDARHRSLGLGLVDGVVMAVAERLEAEAIITLDLRHFGAVSLEGRPRLLPRDRR